MQEDAFLIDCATCKKKVVGKKLGGATRGGSGGPRGSFGERLVVGECTECNSLLVAESYQTHFKSQGAELDKWSDFIRVHPSPLRSFNSNRIPPVLTDSLEEANKALQAGAPVAACAMYGRALEALCRDVLGKKKNKPDYKVMLGKGIEELRDESIIDERLFNWSQEMHAFRNMAAHPDQISVSRDDVEDLRVFVYAIIEFVYDLTDRYEEFMARKAKTKQ